MFKIGVIGHTGRGNYGHGLDVVWKSFPNCKIVAVADADPDGLQKAKERLNVKQGFADYRQMLDDARPDIVSICPRWIDQHRDMAVAPELHRALCDLDIVVPQGLHRLQNGVHPESHMGKAGILRRDVHEDVGAAIVIVRVEDEIELHVVGVLHDCDRVVVGLVNDLEPEEAVKGHRAVQVRHADADMVDGLDLHESLPISPECSGMPGQGETIGCVLHRAGA